MTNSALLANLIYYSRHFSMTAESTAVSEDVVSVLHSLGTRLGNDGSFCEGGEE
jgi:hypothetical protein